jgi:hypothetical protein
VTFSLSFKTAGVAETRSHKAKADDSLVYSRRKPDGSRGRFNTIF